MRDPGDYVAAVFALALVAVVLSLPFLIWADFYLENKRLDILAEHGCAELQVRSD